MVFNWSLSDSKSPQVSRTLLRIRTDLNSAVVGMVSTCLLISKSSNPFTKHSGIVPRELITIGINVTFTFHCFFSSLTRSKYSYFYVLLFLVCFQPGRQNSTGSSFYFYLYFFLPFFIFSFISFSSYNFIFSFFFHSRPRAREGCSCMCSVDLRFV